MALSFNRFTARSNVRSAVWISYVVCLSVLWTASQSARTSKITDDGLTRWSGTGCSMTVGLMATNLDKDHLKSRD